MDAPAAQRPFLHRLSPWEKRAHVLFAALAIMIVQLQADTTNHAETSAVLFQSTLEDYMDPTKTIPFYRSRVMMRWLIEGFHRLTGLSYDVSNQILQTLFLGAALIVLYWFLRRFLIPLAASAGVFLTAAWMGWSFIGLGGQISFAYDYPAFFFSVAGMLLLVTRQNMPLVVMLAVAAFNKETVIWLAGAYFFLHWRWPPDMRATAWSAVLALAVLIPFYLARSWFGHTGKNPTSTLMFFWWENTMEILLWLRGTPFQNIYLIIFLPHAMALAAWRSFPWELKGLYLGALLVYTPAMYLVGNFVEVRIFHEVLPLAVLGIMLQAPGATRCAGQGDPPGNNA